MDTVSALCGKLRESRDCTISRDPRKFATRRQWYSYRGYRPCNAKIERPADLSNRKFPYPLINSISHDLGLRGNKTAVSSQRRPLRPSSQGSSASDSRTCSAHSGALVQMSGSGDRELVFSPTTSLTLPRAASPQAAPAMFCSAMNISKNRCGYSFLNVSL